MKVKMFEARLVSVDFPSFFSTLTRFFSPFTRNFSPFKQAKPLEAA